MTKKQLDKLHDCNGVPNVMCLNCWKVVEQRCDCPSTYIKFCSCKNPRRTPEIE